MDKALLEVCVDSLESAIAAENGGADRLELCANLIIGGTSPSLKLIEQVMQNVKIPVNVLLRPRFGDFCFTRSEIDILKGEIRDAKACKVNGIVIGVLNPDGTLDTKAMSELISIADQLEITLHRAIDVSKDYKQVIEQSKQLGIKTILTSGQSATAIDGVNTIADMVKQANGEIVIMAGSGVSSENIPTIAEIAGITHFHISAKKRINSPMEYRKQDVPMGLPMASEYDRWYADEDTVRKAKQIVVQTLCE